jgi:hypothetical protein
MVVVLRIVEEENSTALVDMENNSGTLLNINIQTKPTEMLLELISRLELIVPTNRGKDKNMNPNRNLKSVQTKTSIRI